VLAKLRAYVGNPDLIVAITLAPPTGLCQRFISPRPNPRNVTAFRFRPANDSVIKRWDQLQACLRTLDDPSFVEVAPAPITRIVPGVDADPRRGHAPGIDANRAVACD